MSASNTADAARGNENRFQALTPASLSSAEKSSVVKLALAVLSLRYRAGRSWERKRGYACSPTSAISMKFRRSRSPISSWNGNAQTGYRVIGFSS